MFAFSWRLNGWALLWLYPKKHKLTIKYLNIFSIEITRYLIFSTLLLFLFFFCWTHFSHVIPTVLFDVHVSVCFLFWSVFHFRMPNVRTVINFMAQTRKQNGKMESKKHVLLGENFSMGHEISYSVYFSFIWIFITPALWDQRKICVRQRCQNFSLLNWFG